MLLHEGCVPAEDMIVDVRVFFLNSFGGPCKDANQIRFAGADVHIPGDHLVGQGDLTFCHSHQLQNLLRPFAQEHALLGQQHLAGALGPPNQQLLAQLVFQCLQLGGKGRLGKMQ